MAGAVNPPSEDVEGDGCSAVVSSELGEGSGPSEDTNTFGPGGTCAVGASCRRLCHDPPIGVASGLPVSGVWCRRLWVELPTGAVIGAGQVETETDELVCRRL